MEKDFGFSVQGGYDRDNKAKAVSWDVSPLRTVFLACPSFY